MAAFARMLPGEWKMTVESGTSSFRTWHWGPGRHSMRVMTDGQDAAGNPWRDLAVYYWHSGRGEVRELGVSQFARGVAEGTITFDGDAARSDFDLHQTGGRRTLRSLWTFDGPDKYRATLLEVRPSDDAHVTPLVAWDLVRTEPPNPPRPLAVEGATEPSELLQPLGSLLGAWETKVNMATGGTLHTRSKFEWIPFADAIYARVLAPGKDGEPAHLLDAYFYHHTGTGTLRCLALSSCGGVFEGDISVIEGGDLQVELTGHEGDQAVPHLVRFGLEKGGTLRIRAWSLKGTERTLTLDIQARKLEPAGDWPVLSRTAASALPSAALEFPCPGPPREARLAYCRRESTNEGGPSG
jgi:hypothetical protein